MNVIKVEVEDNLSCENSCFLCLQQVTQTNQELTNSLNFLFKYIKITEIKEALVCKKCGTNLTNFAKLFRLLEKVRLEMDYLLDFIQSEICISNQNLTLQPSKFSFARDSLLEKCRKQIKYPKAQIILQKLEISNHPKTPSSDSSDFFPDWDDNSTSSVTSDDDELSATPVIKEIKNIKTEVNFEDFQTNSKAKITSKNVKCPTCFKILSNNTYLKNHIDSVHLHLKPFKCSTCSKSFSQNLSLRKHINAVHLRLKPHLCELCGMSFSNIYTLRCHKATSHERKPPKIPGIFSCEKCEKTFNTLQLLTYHMRNVHAPKSCQCNVCHKMFRNSLKLQIHNSAVHEKRRLYCQAPGCDKSYSTPSLLTNHYRLEHKDFTVAIPKKPDHYENKFIEKGNIVECVICKVHFKSVKIVKQHLKKAHGCMRFKCPDCDYGTQFEASLNKHVKIKH